MKNDHLPSEVANKGLLSSVMSRSLCYGYQRAANSAAMVVFHRCVIIKGEISCA